MQDKKRIHIPLFTKGINTATANTKLPDTELEIIENWRLGVEGYDGVLLKRTGYDRKNANQHGSASKSIQSIYEYINGSSSYLLANNSNVGSSKLEYLTDYSSGSWTNISTDTAERARLRFATIKDKLYIANRSVGSTMYSNKFWDGTNYVDMGCPPPNSVAVSLSSSNTTNGYLTNSGVYKYAVSFIYDGNIESPLMGYKDITLGATDDTVTISSLPTTTQDAVANGRITGRKIYRTKTTGNTFYLLGIVSNNTDTVYVDTTGDTSLIDEIDYGYYWRINAPAYSQYIAQHKDRAVLANLTINLYSAPANTVTLTGSDTGGNLGSGIYKYRIYKAFEYRTSAGKQGFILSNPLDKTVNLSGLTGTDNSVTVDWSSLTVEKWFNRIFVERTSVGSSDYKYSFHSSYGTGSYVDILSDVDLGYASALRDEIKVSETKTSFPNVVMVSDADKPDAFSNIEILPDGFLDTSPNSWVLPEAITGIHSEKDRLIIFTGRAIYELDTTAKSRLFWKTNKLIDGVGSQAGLQCQTPEGYFFIPETVTNELSRICLFNANRVIDVGKPISKYMSNNSIFTFLDIKYYQQLNEVWLLTETSGGVSFIFKYRIDINEWTVDVGGSDLNFNSLGATLNNGIMLGSNDGYIHYQALGVYQDKIAGSLTSYTTKAKTKHFNLPDGDLNPSKFLATLQTTGGSTSTATVRYAVEDGTEYTTTLNSDQSGTTNLADGTHRLRTKSFNSNVTNNGKRDIYFQLETTNAKFEVLKDMTIELEERNQAIGGK